AILGKWAEVKDSDDVEKVRNFVTMFGSSLPVGRAARLHLAEMLLAQDGPAALLDAERHLLLLEREADDPLLAGRGVETLARLLTRKGLLEDAARCYRTLRDTYGNVPIREGKTGADLEAELATDKRFLPYVGEKTAPRKLKIKAA